MAKFSLSLFLSICLTIHLIGQNVPPPKSVLGYEIGEQFSRHHQVVDYFKAVAASNPKEVHLEKYGMTNERRPLYLAIVSSKENMAKLEEIRKAHLQNTKLVDEQIEKPEIAIVWLSYNVHGNEASATEAALLTLYQLLTEHKSYLENTIVIIDPCVNPDGRDRYVNWYNETASEPYDSDPNASEHNEPWPGGRPNHYLFDLNRDWVWATQIETQERLKLYNKWLPHIHVDFHEQGINSPYYFAPAAEPFHEIITDWQRDFQTQIGKNHASYFDKNGWLFFTRESFDLLYPSYGDTYPTFMGAIGMTYEQAGHGRAGIGILNAEGDLLTLEDRLVHHTTTGMSTVEMASKYAQRLNEEFARFFENKDFEYKSYILKGHKDKIRAVAALLNQHEIDYAKASKGKVSGYLYSTAAQGKLELSEDDLVIHTDQPKGTMVKVLFEPKAAIADSLTYDITAWSVPYAYGLEAIASKSKVKDAGEFNETAINPLAKAYGYVCEWKSVDDAKFLSALLQNNIKVRFTEKPFKPNGKSFERGALIITKGDNDKVSDFLNTLNRLAEKYQREIYPIASGFSERGPDVGSSSIKVVKKQKVAILSGEGTSSLSYGELWHFFEKQLKYPATSINTNAINRIDLNDYSTLIIPNGYYGNVLNNNTLNKIKDWVRQGGKLMAIGNALRSFAGKDGFGISAKNVETDNNKPNLVAYADRERFSINNAITGAIFTSKIDNTHPMAFGYPKHYFTLKLGTTNYELLKSGYNVGYITDPKVYSGFAGKSALTPLENSLLFGEERLGRGSLIYMIDNILFRSFWENGKLFLVNSVFFVNSNAFNLNN